MVKLPLIIHQVICFGHACGLMSWGKNDGKVI